MQKSPASDPVTVSFKETTIEADCIGGATLRRHIQSCLDFSKEGDHKTVISQYERALAVLKGDTVRCLQIVDSGTTGLQGKNWKSLVVQQGSVSKLGAAPGGSNGIGKNAVLNLSDLRTVFYSTRYTGNREGRVEKVQGKATLMTHEDPGQPGELLRHVGFYAISEESGKPEPLYVPNIPQVFRLDDVGTGVYIMGFHPRSADWGTLIAKAVVENFFAAIHNRLLVVHITAEGETPITVNHETLDGLFERVGGDMPSRSYYKAIRDSEQFTTASIGSIGPLSVHLLFAPGAPRRTSYINRNGMLITDSREQKTNPFAPRGNNLWPNYAAVVSPTTDAGDSWVRRTENPSHDSMSSQTLLDESESRQTEIWFKESRDAIKAIINEAANIQRYGDTTNLKELARFFQDELDPTVLGITSLPIRERDIRIPPPLIQVDEDDANEGTGPDRPEDPNPERKPPRPPRPPRPGPNPGPVRTRRRPQRLSRPRLLVTGTNSAVLAFTVESKTPEQMKLALTPTGAEWSGPEGKLAIASLQVIRPAGQEVSLLDGGLALTPSPGERIVLEITTQEPLLGRAFRLGQ